MPRHSQRHWGYVLEQARSHIYTHTHTHTHAHARTVTNTHTVTHKHKLPKPKMSCARQLADMLDTRHVNLRLQWQMTMLIQTKASFKFLKDVILTHVWRGARSCHGTTWPHTTMCQKCLESRYLIREQYAPPPVSRSLSSGVPAANNALPESPSGNPITISTSPSISRSASSGHNRSMPRVLELAQPTPSIARTSPMSSASSTLERTSSATSGGYRPPGHDVMAKSAAQQTLIPPARSILWDTR
jgi:hypothetical protein